MTVGERSTKPIAESRGSTNHNHNQSSMKSQQPRGRGRPPLPADRKKSIRMETLVDQSTLDKVQKEARRRGISQNEFVRQLIHNA